MMKNREINLILEQAYCFVKQGDYENSIALYQECIEAEPDTLSHYWYLGLAYLLKGEELEAQSIWVSPFIERNPEDYEAGMAKLLIFLQEQAYEFLVRHQAEVAETIYWQALEIDDDLFDIYTNLGIALSDQGKYDEAISCFKTALALEPHQFRPYQLQGEIFERLEQFDRALACYSQVLDIHLDSEITYHIGLCYLRCQQFEEAIVYFDKSIQLNPDFAPAYSDLGYALLQRSQLEPAKAFFESALKLDSGFVQSYLNFRLLENQKETYTESSYTLFDRLLERVNLNRATQARMTELSTEVERSPEPEPSLHASENEVLKTGFEIPQGFYETTFEWINSSRLDPSNYIKIFDNNIITLKPPKTLENSIHCSFHFAREIKLPDSFVAAIPNGRFWLNDSQTRSAIVAPDNRLLGNLSPETPILEPGHPDKHPSKHSIFQRESLPPPQHIEGTVAILLGLSNDVYFHWMLDILPRFELLNLSEIETTEIDYFLIDDRTGFQQESIQILNLPKSKLLKLSSALHLRADRLIVPSFPGSVAWMPSWTCDFLKRQFLSSECDRFSDVGDRIYISRGQAQSRRVLNEEEVIALLEKFGFRTVTLESMSIREQASLLSKASVVVSPHGSGLTNLVFCQPGTKAIEIFAPYYVYPCYWLLSNLVNLDYYYVLGENSPGFYLRKLMYPDERHEDIYVDIKKLEKVVELALSQ